MSSSPAGDSGRAGPKSDALRDREPSSKRCLDGPAEASALARAERRIRELEAENQALRAEAERLHHLLDSVALYAIVTLDLEGRVTGWNEGAHAILGYEHGEILGRSGEVFFPAEDRAEGAFVKELCRAMNEGHAPNERWHLRRDGSRFWASGLTMPLLREDGEPEGFVSIMRDNTAGRAEEERRALMLAEMVHRMKNVLATVQAIAGQTLRRSDVPPEVQDALEERLMALAAAHDLLTRGGGEGAALAEVVRRALTSFSGTGRVRAGGAPVWVAADAVEMLNLAFHELATNAAKYGALSVPDGHVEVSWSLRRFGKSKRLVEISWRERGGPPVVPPAHQGFGTRLLERGLAQKVDGTVKLSFLQEGLECQICLPVLAGGS
ncbi:HWE histidine kinase domain-containing protein [Sabulicella rubraurantiaca]|uniref:HWE histidine kinase domain-containing protein n=1 Tax=Sabulicella rubraurantiaca TaxID=2811429 RepID=UPI001A978567|nr:HWE histidine kinase domain-containing protein [Sabulicella rubraurantiaca]